MSVQDLYGLILTNYDIFEPYIVKLKFHSYNFKNNKSINVEIEKTKVYTPLSVLREEDGSGLRVARHSDLGYLNSLGYVLFSAAGLDLEMLKTINSLYKIDFWYNDFVCHSSELDVLLQNFSSNIFNIRAPKATIKSGLLEYYIIANGNM